MLNRSDWLLLRKPKFLMPHCFGPLLCFLSYVFSSRSAAPCGWCSVGCKIRPVSLQLTSSDLLSHHPLPIPHAVKLFILWANIGLLQVPLCDNMIEYRDEGVTSALGLGTYRNSIYGNGMSNPLKADVVAYLRKTSSPKQSNLRSFSGPK